MLFKGTPLSFILLPLVTLIVVTVLILRWRIGKRQFNPVEKSFKRFMLIGIAFGVVVGFLWFALPLTPPLSTFGRPVEINSFNEVLKHLQDYNDALVRTTEVVHAFLFLFLFWFLLAVFELFTAISGETPNHRSLLRADSELHPDASA